MEDAPCLQNESVDEASKDMGKDRCWTYTTFYCYHLGISYEDSVCIGRLRVLNNISDLDIIWVYQYARTLIPR